MDEDPKAKFYITKSEKPICPLLMLRHACGLVSLPFLGLLFGMQQASVDALGMASHVSQ